MGSLANVLAGIPGYGAYVARRQMNEDAGVSQLQQARAAIGLSGAMQEQEMRRRALEMETAMRKEIAEAGNDPVKLRAVAAKYSSPKDLLKMRTEGYTLAPGAKRFGPDGKEIASNPAAPKMTQLELAIQARDRYPEGSRERAMIDAFIQKQTTRAPGVTVNMPSSSGTFQGKDGVLYQVQIGKDGTTRAVPITGPNGEPLGKPESSGDRNARIKAESEATEAEANISQVKDQVKEMVGMIQKDPTVVGLAGTVRRGAEAVAGVSESLGGPAVPPAAINYSNKQKLLLSSVRKMVEKDPNLSRDERERLTEITGGGMFQTPTSAMEALSEIAKYVERKQAGAILRGAKKNGGIKEQVEAAGFPYEPNRYEYRIHNGEVQRRAK